MYQIINNEIITCGYMLICVQTMFQVMDIFQQKSDASLDAYEYNNP